MVLEFDALFGENKNIFKVNPDDTQVLVQDGNRRIAADNLFTNQAFSGGAKISVTLATTSTDWYLVDTLTFATGSFVDGFIEMVLTGAFNSGGGTFAATYHRIDVDDVTFTSTGASGTIIPTLSSLRAKVEPKPATGSHVVKLYFKKNVVNNYSPVGHYFWHTY